MGLWTHSGSGCSSLRPADFWPRGLVQHMQLRDAPVAHTTEARTVLHSNRWPPAPSTQHTSSFSHHSHHLAASTTYFSADNSSLLPLALLTPLLSRSKRPAAAHPIHSGPLTQSLLPHFLGSLIPLPWCACLGEISVVSTQATL